MASIVRRFRAGEIASEYYDRDKGWYLTPGTVARFFRDCSTKFENVVNSLESHGRNLAQHDAVAIYNCRDQFAYRRRPLLVSQRLHLSNETLDASPLAESHLTNLRVLIRLLDHPAPSSSSRD